MPGTIPLTVVILARNEAQRIKDCICSVGWAAEVLVVDDESTDDTVARAQALGARVVRRRMDVEGRHRNWAHQQATYDWILSLDADERVTPELAEEIAGLFSAGEPPYRLYAIPRRNFIGSVWLQHGGWYPSAQLKLLDRRIFRWEETTVHPRAIANVECGQLRNDLLHHSYRDCNDFRQKLERQTALEAEKWHRDGRRVTVGKALWRTVDRSFRSYVLKQGFRDGAMGWFAARMAGRYQWLSYSKYRAIRRRAARP